jgi:hypothetical protein
MKYYVLAAEGFEAVLGALHVDSGRLDKVRATCANLAQTDSPSFHALDACCLTAFLFPSLPALSGYDGHALSILETE